VTSEAPTRGWRLGAGGGQSVPSAKPSMTDIDKIVGLLSNEAVERRIAAAIVLGEIRAKGTLVVDALASTLDTGIVPLQRHALEALARLGAKRAVTKILPLLASRDDEVRRAAVAAIASVGDDVLPTLRARNASASGEEKRSIDAILASLGGRDAFEALLDGLAASDAETAKAAAIAVRQRVKDADGRQRRTYFAQVQKFLEKAARRGGSPGAIAAGVKILGYLEDERAIPALLELTKREGNAAAVRQEALIALRFLLGKHSDGKTIGTVVGALVDAAQDPDRTLAQTALHTLAGVPIPAEAMRRIEKLVTHADLERARFAMEMLGRQEGPESARLLVQVLATTGDRRRAELAAACLRANDPSRPDATAIRPEAVTPLARALLDAPDADRSWLLRSVLRPSASKASPAVRKQLLDAAMKRLGSGQGHWEPLLAAVRDGDARATLEPLRALAQKLKKSDRDKALEVLRVLCHGEGASDEDRYALAVAELAHGSRDTRPAARGSNEALRLFGALLDRGADVAAMVRKDRTLELEDLYFLGFHFAEEKHPLGEELLRLIVEKGGRAKVAKMAKSKLALGQPGA
jgi:HEAT repeat protein